MAMTDISQQRPHGRGVSRLRSALVSMLAIGLCVGVFATGQLAAQSIQLRQGAILVGEIQEATGDGLTFRRLDNGGLLELSWADLTQTSADRVRRLKGLLVEDEEPVTVLADVLEFEVAGGIRETIVGRIVGENSSSFQIRRKSATLDVKRSSIKNRKRREVPILEIYTRQDYYDELLAKHDPSKDADKHVQLADELRRAGDLVRSKQHLEEASTLGGGRQATQIASMLARLELEIANKAENDQLTQIRQRTNRGDFDGAAAAIAQFSETFGEESKLASNFEREKRRFERARKASLTDRIRTLWSQKIHRVLTEAVSDPKMTLSRARDYAESKMGDDMFATLSTTIGVEADEVRSLWESRNADKKGRNTAFSYGVGSWVLGADDIIKDTKVAETGQAEDSGASNDPDVKRIIKLIREQKKRARDLARRSTGDETASPESWWKSQKLAEKRQWLRAYFAEYGGHMEVVKATAMPCLNCTGVGSITSLGTSGKPVKTQCPVCRGTKFTRLVRAR